VRRDAVELLRRLIVCDTSNPPGREAQAAAVLEDYFSGSGIECERVAKDPERPNLVARLRGHGTGPSLAFVGHLDVVQARRQDWSVEPFAAVVRDGAIWGRGAVDMKSQVAASAVALAHLAREGFVPNGDVMLLLMADEEVGEAEVGAPFFVEERPELAPDFVVGEGAGERFETPRGPIYLLDCGVKATASATLTVRGRAGDASLPNTESSAAFELARLLGNLGRYAPPPRVHPALEELLDFLAPGAVGDADRVEAACAAHPGLDRIVRALVMNVIPPTVIDAPGPANVVLEEAKVTLQCAVLPGDDKHALEREIRAALGDGEYELDVSEPEGGLVSAADSPLRDAIQTFLRERDPDAALIPALAYGYSDCHLFREKFGSTAYGFIPFPHADPTVNLTCKHGVDERVLIEDLVFQTETALHVARTIGASTSSTSTNGGDRSRLRASA
jgi:acetylornithine deacetylase/succinyl-diaminopimelate desuccinylase-like protein